MKLTSIMTKKVVTVGMDTTLGKIYEIFNQKKFHHLLVVEDNQLCGVISDRDVLKAISPFLDTLAEQSRDLSTLKKKAHQIMTRKPITISKELSSKDAAKLILQKNISCLPIVSSDGCIDGIVTWKDLLKAYSHCVDVA